MTAEAATVATAPTDSAKTEKQKLSIDTLKSQLQPQLAAQCDTIQASLEIGQPLELEQLYVDPNILPHLSRQQWLEVNELQTTQTRQPLAHTNPDAISGKSIVEKYPKLLIFGKPGSGKTTLLEHLAIQCIQNQFQAERLPIFISLRYLDPHNQQPGATLFRSICQNLQPCALEETSVKQLLQDGTCLVLLDGLDEVPQQQQTNILTEIRYFTQQYFNNHFVITSRLTSQHYDFPGFVSVELDDFNNHQIEAFVQQWFHSNHPDSTQGQLKATQFIEEINKPSNQSLRELIVTPILLSLVCSIFLRRTTFPRKRDRVYQAGLDILLENWDLARGIQRDQAYRNLASADN